MSSIDLAILGLLKEGAMSAYEIQKAVEDRYYARWTSISTPSVYKKVLRLRDQGYLESQAVRGERSADKAVYSLTAAGRDRFEELMAAYTVSPVSFLFDFNVVIANLEKADPSRVRFLMDRLRRTITDSARTSQKYADKAGPEPPNGPAIFRQQQRLYQALLAWLDDFEAQLREDRAE